MSDRILTRDEDGRPATMSCAVLVWQRDTLVWVAETSHKRYEVWTIGAGYVFKTEAEANAEQFKHDEDKIQKANRQETGTR